MMDAEYLSKHLGLVDNYFIVKVSGMVIKDHHATSSVVFIPHRSGSLAEYVCMVEPMTDPQALNFFLATFSNSRHVT